MVADPEFEWQRVTVAGVDVAPAVEQALYILNLASPSEFTQLACGRHIIVRHETTVLDEQSSQLEMIRTKRVR